jgi:hypothetical protein
VKRPWAPSIPPADLRSLPSRFTSTRGGPRGAGVVRGPRTRARVGASWSGCRGEQTTLLFHQTASRTPHTTRPTPHAPRLHEYAHPHEARARTPHAFTLHEHAHLYEAQRRLAPQIEILANTA